MCFGTDLLHDVKVGFHGGKCSRVDFVCPGVDVVSVRKKIRRSLRFAQRWGEKFHERFDLYDFWKDDNDLGSDINMIQVDVDDTTIDIDYEDLETFTFSCRIVTLINRGIPSEPEKCF